MKKPLIITLVVIAILGIGGYAILHKSPAKTETSTTATSTSQQQSTTSNNSSTATANTITFDGTQFSPATMTVKSGTVITVKNTSSDSLQLDSDPHPAHTDDTDLNVGTVAPGASKTFTVTKTGSYGYHNHLDPTVQAKITVE